MNKKFIIIPIMLITFMFGCGDSEAKELERQILEKEKQLLDKQLEEIALKEDCMIWEAEYLRLSRIEDYRTNDGTLRFSYIHGTEAREAHVKKYNVRCIIYGVEHPTPTRDFYGAKEN
tara:strand:+ start:89 stop:442 length:354 start_codon:yes stop_codon:yes gene_type:complete